MHQASPRPGEGAVPPQGRVALLLRTPCSGPVHRFLSWLAARPCLHHRCNRYFTVLLSSGEVLCKTASHLTKTTCYPDPVLYLKHVYIPTIGLTAPLKVCLPWGGLALWYDYDYYILVGKVLLVIVFIVVFWFCGQGSGMWRPPGFGGVSCLWDGNMGVIG